MSRLPEECPLGCSKLGAVVTAGKQMPVHVGRHLDARVPESVLHDLQGQSQTPVLASVDAPARVEMPEGVQARIFRGAFLRHDAGGNLDGGKPTGDDVRMILDLTGTGWEDEAFVALGASEFPVAQGVCQDRRHGDGTLTDLALGLANYLELVGALPDVDFRFL